MMSEILLQFSNMDHFISVISFGNNVLALKMLDTGLRYKYTEQIATKAKQSKNKTR